MNIKSIAFATCFFSRWKLIDTECLKSYWINVKDYRSLVDYYGEPWKIQGVFAEQGGPCYVCVRNSIVYMIWWRFLVVVSCLRSLDLFYVD